MESSFQPSRPGAAALDRYSWLHLASGYALARYGVTPGNAWLILCGFEVFEAVLRGTQGLGQEGQGLKEFESKENIAADILVGMIGYFLQRKT